MSMPDMYRPRLYAMIDLQHPLALLFSRACRGIRLRSNRHLRSGVADHRIDRCYLKGEQGDRLNAVLCAAGYNIK